MPPAVDPRDDLLRLEPYLSEFAEAALAEAEDTALLAAIALRETWAGWAPGYTPKGTHLGFGDSGHGFGLFQIDNRGPYAHLPKECPDASAFLQARWACWVLKDARRDLVHFRGSAYFERAVLSTYNAGAPAVRRALLMGHDPDRVTTRQNYGADVLFRRDRLVRAHPERFPRPGGVA